MADIVDVEGCEARWMMKSSLSTASVFVLKMGCRSGRSG